MIGSLVADVLARPRYRRASAVDLTVRGIAAAAAIHPDTIDVTALQAAQLDSVITGLQVRVLPR